MLNEVSIKIPHGSKSFTYITATLERTTDREKSSKHSHKWWNAKQQSSHPSTGHLLRL